MLCNQCNKEVPEGAKFCPFCGTALPLPELESVAIESTVLDESRDQDEDFYIYRPKRKKKEKKELQPFKGKKKWLASVIRASAALMLALVMMVMAFLPLVSVEHLYGYNDHIVSSKMNINAFQAMALFASSLKSLDYDQASDAEKEFWNEHLDLQEKAEAITEKLRTADYDDLSFSEKRTLSRYYFKSALCSAQYKYSPTTPMLVCMAILSLLYILLCLAVLVIAVLYLLSLFGIPNVHPNNFWRALLSLFSFVPVCLISLAFSCSAIYARKVSLASPAIVTLCAVALFFAGAISVAYLFGDVKKRPNPIPKILTTALTIVLIVGAFAPAFHCDVWGTFRGRETPTTVTIQEGYSYFNSLVLTEDQVNSLEDQWEDTDVDFKESTKSAVSFLFYRSVKNIKAGFGSYDNRSVLRSLETGYRMFDYYPLFALIPVCMLSAVIFALLIIRQALVSSCVTPKKRFRSPLVFKILLVVSLVIALSIMIVYLSTLSQRITRYQLHDYSIGISGGIIVALSVSALLFFVPANERLSNKRKAPRDRNFYTVFGEEEAVTEEAVN